MLPDNGRRVKPKNNYHITPEELKFLFNYIRLHCDTKYEIIISLMAFRGMRPKEALACNMLDFSESYTKLTYREAKTNKIRHNQTIVKPLAKRIATYISMNKHRLTDGWLFPYNTKKTRSKGGKIYIQPFMDSMTFAVYFSKIRWALAKNYNSFNEKYMFKYKNGRSKFVYRIHPYSLRRFFETYFYINNNYNLALLKEIMDYSSKFDPMKSYIKIIHREKQRSQYIQDTFTPLANRLISNQTTLEEFKKNKKNI